MDLSKAFDTLPPDLIVKKPGDYGGDSKVINLVTIIKVTDSNVLD